jgi:hypothetical protein
MAMADSSRVRWAVDTNVTFHKCSHHHPAPRPAVEVPPPPPPPALLPPPRVRPTPPPLQVCILPWRRQRLVCSRLAPVAVHYLYQVYCCGCDCVRVASPRAVCALLCAGVVRS